MSATVRRRVGQILSWTALAALAALLVFAAAWRLQGGRWERVQTPSMSTVAPVGTLLWVKPVVVDQLKVGDFISFHPPGEPGITFSHLVYRINPDHTISTKGVIPAPDPWRLTGSDVIGKVQMRWWGVGWLVRAAPVLVVGALLIAAILSWLRISGRGVWRAPVGILLASVVLTVAIVWLRPFTNAQQLAFAPVPSGGANATYVGTGLLPIRLQAHHGAHVVIGSGQVGTVHVSTADTDKKLRVTLRPSVPFWFWFMVVAVCFVPAALVTAFGRGPGRAVGAS